MSPSISPPSREAEVPDTVIGRVFAILRAFGPETTLGASDLARATGLPRSTTHRIARQLVRERILTRVGDKYRPAVGLFELAAAAHPARLRDAIVPYLEDVRRVTGGDVQLAALDGDDVVYLDHVPVRGSTANAVHLGARLPAHATAAGKVLLAERKSTFPAPPGLVAVTACTITDETRLRDELDLTRRRGWSEDHEEAEPGRVGVAVPLRNRHGRVLAALSVTSPTGTLDVSQTVGVLQVVARTLTRVGQAVNIPYLGRLRPP